MKDAQRDADVDAAVAALAGAALRSLHALEFAARHVAPQTLARLSEALAGRDADAAAALATSRALSWPDRLGPVRDALEAAAEAAREGVAGLRAAPAAAQPMLAAYRSLRSYARAAEAIYPLAAFLKPVGRFFLEPGARDDERLLARFADAGALREDVGVLHLGGPRGARGAFSLYVPEYYDPAHAWPLVAALHGGSGDGGAFLWSWVREARTRGFIVLAPTASGSTWSLMEPRLDGEALARMVEHVAGGWNVEPSRSLLTGMSDGGTFCYAYGLGADCRFTHLAPVAASFHPMMLSVMADAGRLRSLPIRIAHGAQDWMFPATMAQEAHRSLQRAGAAATYREIADLAHAYPREENAAILDWFLA